MAPVVSIYVTVWTPEGEEVSMLELVVSGRATVKREERQHLNGPRTMAYFVDLNHRLPIFWEINRQDYRRLKRLLRDIKKGPDLRPWLRSNLK